MATRAEDSAETILPTYAEALDLIGFERLGRTGKGAALASDRWPRCSS